MDMSKMYIQMLGDMGQSARRVSILFGSGVVSTSQEILRRDGKFEEITPVQISVLPDEGDYVISPERSNRRQPHGVDRGVQAAMPRPSAPHGKQPR